MPVTSEPVEGGEGEMEGGRGTWEDGGKPKSERRRKQKANQKEGALQETSQLVFDGDTACRETPGNYQSLDFSSSKRQCLDDFAGNTKQQEGTGGTGDYEIPTTNDGRDPPEDHTYLHDTTSSLREQEETGVLRRREGEEEEEEGREEIFSVMREQQTKIQGLLSKCEEALNEGMAYEALFPLRIDEMLRATRDLEQSLIDQKQAMKDRLQEILGLL